MRPGWESPADQLAMFLYVMRSGRVRRDERNRTRSDGRGWVTGADGSTNAGPRHLGCVFNIVNGEFRLLNPDGGHTASIRTGAGS